MAERLPGRHNRTRIEPRDLEPIADDETEAVVGNKDKGAAKASKKTPAASIKEKRAAKKAKKAAAGAGRSGE